MRSLILTNTTDNDAAMVRGAAVFAMQALRASHKYGFNLDDPLPLLPEVATVVGLDNDTVAGVAFVMKSGEIKCMCGSGGCFDDLVKLCIAAGGTWLTCYDIGWLVDGYKKHGFVIKSVSEFDEKLGENVPRWAGTPDVIKMRL